MGTFDGSDEVMGDDMWFQAGQYIVELVEVKEIAGGYRGDSLVIRAMVLSAASDHDKHPRAGTVAAHVLKTDGDKRKMGMKDWYNFLCACFGVQYQDYNADWWKTTSLKVVGQEQFLAGSRHYIEVWEKPKRNKPKPGTPPYFTQHDWKGPPTPELLREFGLAAA